MFCEGTRFTAKKHAKSIEYAKSKGLPELKHHLLPRTKGFCLLAKGAAGRSMFEITFYNNT
jgi:lysophosphatidic acid acyltransferase/lysophosphatidylinositol acyltransferase